MADDVPHRDRDEERLAEYDKALRCMIDPSDWICRQS